VYSKYKGLNIHISEKALQDLEFTTVIQQVANFSISELGKKQVLETLPYSNKKRLLRELEFTNEYLSSFESDNRIPNHGFDNIYEQIKRLTIEDSYIETESFLKIATTSETIKELKKYFKKFNTYFPQLSILSEKVDFVQEIIDDIKKVISPYGEVVDNASPELRKIRRSISGLNGKIGQSFSSALSKAKASGYLDDIKESIIDNHRVLAVLAMYRKKVTGSLLGSSKSGNIVYIAPQATLTYQRELQNLEYEEKQEVIRILKTLSHKIRPYSALLESHLDYLTHLDVISSKTKYAYSINGLLPKIDKNKRVYFKDAFHPILFVNNKEEDLEVIPQTIELNEKQQIIVISGPNAGGKSITLKTIGLLQIMLQSGILIPVNEQSETTIFDTILTDIGDNQSIENQLSTYSYRLKNMRYFLRKCNEKTLFLIDEFGTGSDPELGGALAEIFLEEFYHKKAFGIITTHYSNLKVLANELDYVTNANMQFNEQTLEPLYKLYVGQAGSSFTFEVAQKNGIPFSLINKAKKRVETEKIRLDKTISKLQKERNRLHKNSENLEKQKFKGLKHIESLQDKEEKIQAKLAGFQELYDKNQKMLSLGRKTNELFNKYLQTNNKKELTLNFNKWVADEKVKYAKKNPIKPKTKSQKQQAKIVKKQLQEVIQKVENEVMKKVVEIRKVKHKEAEKLAKLKSEYIFKINDSVRLKDGNSVGTIERIEKKKAFINFGNFTTEAALEKLELVKKSKG
jgi:DNA mismatch repair protein MutS2